MVTVGNKLHKALITQHAGPKGPIASVLSYWHVSTSRDVSFSPFTADKKDIHV